MRILRYFYLLSIPFSLCSLIKAQGPNDNHAITFQSYPTTKNHIIQFAYTGYLARFVGTEINCSYFKNNQLRVGDVEISYNGNKIIGKFKLPDNVKAFTLRIYNHKFGGDDNDNRGYIYGVLENKILVKGALYWKSKLISSRLVMMPTKNTFERALSLQEEEFERYPALKKQYVLDHLELRYKFDSSQHSFIERKLGMLLSDSLKTMVLENSLRQMAKLYKDLQNKVMHDSVENITLKRYPLGVTAALHSLQLISHTQKRDSVIVLMKKIHKKFSKNVLNKKRTKEMVSRIYDGIAISFFKEKKYFKFLHYQNLIPDKQLEATEMVRFYTHIQYKKDTLPLPVLKKYANQAMDAVTKSRKQKPVNVSKSYWNRLVNNYYPCCVDIVAISAYKHGNFQKAIRLEKSILPFNSGYTGNFNIRYLNFMKGAGDKTKLLEETEKMYIQSKPAPGIDSILKAAYEMNYGKEASRYATYKNRMDSLSHLNSIRDLKKEMLHISAPSFTLEDLKGNRVSLSDFKGKVVILDFWATWCRPCIVSFVGVNKVKKKFSDNKKVVFLFIDGKENTSDKETRITKVKKFLNDKNYQFHVLLDTSGKKSVGSLYHIGAIPVKVYIDKNGIIQFKNMGFSGDPAKLQREVTTKINLLLNN